MPCLILISVIWLGVIFIKGIVKLKSSFIAEIDKFSNLLVLYLLILFNNEGILLLYI
ncbi:hypothetical protein CLVI_31740 [Clostridium vincentii]|uniref:Uncharacterized protein n=1 Tax=Clostridium vincentii TaxID=52704 RepID=A0A2T0B7J1_9CLOT|nr:hypothetical protein CLVI_31740 [Clostridium vincentii]